MSIRKLQYQIDYVHILTFREEYKKAIVPHFGHENLEYGVDNEGSIHEGLRLIFKNEQFAMVIKKEAISFIFEGDIADLRNPNSVIGIFWDIYERIKKFEGYVRTTRHLLIVNAVSIKEKEEMDKFNKENPYLKLNPFGALTEFACVYEFKEDEVEAKVEFGNYSDKDIKKQDLMPFKTDFNKDLINSVGLMGRLELTERERTITPAKYRNLVAKAQEILSKLDLQ